MATKTLTREQVLTRYDWTTDLDPFESWFYQLYEAANGDGTFSSQALTEWEAKNIEETERRLELNSADKEARRAVVLFGNAWDHHGKSIPVL